MARRGALQFRLQHVSAHKNDLNNNYVDGLCTEVIKANDMKPRLKRTRIKVFSSPDNCALPRHKPNTAANYQTFPPYAPLYEDVTPPRGVADLSDDRGNVLHICPLCDSSDPKPFKDRKALLIHLRGRHCGEGAIVSPELQHHFGITLCQKCEVYYTSTGLAGHHCRPGALRRIQVLKQHPVHHLV